MKKLQERLSDWTDVDGAQFCVAQCLGLLPEEATFGEAKHIFWTKNPFGDALFEILEQLVSMNVLEKDSEEMKYRWNARFTDIMQHHY